jgi:hypothetical protein
MNLTCCGFERWATTSVFMALVPAHIGTASVDLKEGLVA